MTAIFLALLIPQFLNAQPLDTLKIKTEADSLLAVADSLRKAWQLDGALEIYQTAGQIPGSRRIYSKSISNCLGTEKEV
jgi:hypothetical protein